MRVVPSPHGVTPAQPVPDFAALDEAALRAHLEGHRLDPASRRAAIAELLRRFPSDAVRAFALNAEARAHLDVWEMDAARAILARVRSEFGASTDPAVEAEVARAMQQEVLAIEMAEARADTGPLRPLSAEDIDLESPSNRLRREIVERYRGRSEPAIRRIVAQERFNLVGSETLRSGRYTDPPRYLALVAEYEDSDDPGTRRLVATILFRLAQFEPDDRQAIAYWDEFLRRFGQSLDPDLRSMVFDAYDNKQYVLDQLGDRAAARRVEAEQYDWFDRAYPPGE